MICTSCAHEISADARFCPSCGREVDLRNSPTVSIGAPPKNSSADADAAVDAKRGSGSAAPNKSARPSSSGSGGFSGYEARYVPGTTLVERYRIVSPLGKGGMGEVTAPRI